MSSLKQSIFLVSVYLAAIFLLAQFDYSDSPIIDFAKYFYFAVMVAVPLTVFFSIHDQGKRFSPGYFVGVCLFCNAANVGPHCVSPK